jgi:putative transcriptional regulator
MSKTGTTRVIVKSGDRKGQTDWKRLDAMADVDLRKAALADPDAQPLGKARLAKMRRVSRVKALRERMGLTQRAFAAAFHLPLTTLRDWEQRRTTPDAPARALLLAIERDPKKLMALLAGKGA